METNKTNTFNERIFAKTNWEHFFTNQKEEKRKKKETKKKKIKLW